jgi:hypothetical protein
MRTCGTALSTYRATPLPLVGPVGLLLDENLETTTSFSCSVDVWLDDTEKLSTM